MSRKGEHIKCMTHKSVCASAPHQRPAEWVASTAAEGNKKINKEREREAISCFTWCGYPISYTKHVAKEMCANALPFLVDVLFLGEPSQTRSKTVWWNIIFWAQCLLLLFLERGGPLGKVISKHVCLFGAISSPKWPLKVPQLHFPSFQRPPDHPAAWANPPTTIKVTSDPSSLLVIDIQFNAAWSAASMLMLSSRPPPDLPLPLRCCSRWLLMIFIAAQTIHKAGVNTPCGFPTGGAGMRLKL